LLCEATLSTNASPGTKALFEMAHWRSDFVQWQAQAESSRKKAADSRQASTSNPRTATPELGTP
jgi:hypothetical protein